MFGNHARSHEGSHRFGPRNGVDSAAMYRRAGTGNKSLDCIRAWHDFGAAGLLWRSVEVAASLWSMFEEQLPLPDASQTISRQKEKGQTRNILEHVLIIARREDTESLSQSSS